MPKFIVTKKVDAYVAYVAEIEAKDADEAHALAQAEDGIEWSYDCVLEFDHTEYFKEDVEPAEEA
jgi:hypothetical protein